MPYTSNMGMMLGAMGTPMGTIGDNGLSIDDFWSTNMLDGAGQPIASLILNVRVQDDLGQSIGAGKHKPVMP